MEPVDDNQVAHFVELTHATAEQAQFFLEANNGNFDRAVAMFFEQSTGGPPAVQPRRQHPSDVPARPRPPAGGGGGTVYNPRGAAAGPLPLPLQLVQSVLSLPLGVVGGGLRLLFRTLGATVSLASAVARHVLPPPLANAVAGVAQALTFDRDLEPAAAASAFARAFSARHGDLHPQWQECGWQEAAARAHAEGRFLLIYLHSAEHQDTPRFCSSTLCNPELAAYVNQAFLSWGGDLRYSDAFRLASSLGTAVFPYVALLAFSGPRTRLLTCVQGSMEAPALLAVLQQAAADHNGLLWQEQAERAQRDHDRRLREEQDAEYQRSLEADRERERQREEQRRQQEAAERAQQEAEERARAAAEAEQQRQADAAAALLRRKQEVVQALPPEPAAGTPDTSLIRIRLPDGSNHQRRFMAADSLKVVYDYVQSLEGVATLHFSLATTYPRRVLTGEALERSLRELELCPQAVLLFQPEDT